MISTTMRERVVERVGERGAQRLENELEHRGGRVAAWRVADDGLLHVRLGDGTELVYVGGVWR